jgi:hypothetical protein
LVPFSCVLAGLLLELEWWWGVQTSWRLTRGKKFPAQVTLCKAGKMYLVTENPGSGQGWGPLGMGFTGFTAVLQLEC